VTGWDSTRSPRLCRTTALSSVDGTDGDERDEREVVVTTTHPPRTREWLAIS
jgi:hypothetical protein